MQKQALLFGKTPSFRIHYLLGSTPFCVYLVNRVSPSYNYNILISTRHPPELGEDADGPAEASGRVEAQAPVQAGDLLDLLLGQLEVKQAEVLLQAVDAVGLRDDDDVALGAPAEQYLAGRLAVLRCDALDDVRLEQRLDSLCVGVAQLQEALRAEGRVARHRDAVLLRHGDELGLRQVRVVLDLQHAKRQLVVRQNVVDELRVEVGNADAAHESVGVLLSLNQLLESLPRLLDRDARQRRRLRLLLVGPEARVADLVEGNELQGDGEVDQEQVEVAETPGLILEAGLLERVLPLMVVVPELGGDEEILALDDTLLNGTADTLSCLGAVGVVPRPVDVAVAKLDGIVYLGDICSARSLDFWRKRYV